MVRLFAVAEGVFILKAVGVAVVSPLLFERSLRFERYGVGLALAFFGGVSPHLATARAGDDEHDAPLARPALGPAALSRRGRPLTVMGRSADGGPVASGRSRVTKGLRRPAA
ncbi:MAG: hypothetical protein PPP55_01710 [Halorubrum sp.]